MPAVMRASAVVEKSNVAAVAIGTSGFEAMGRAIGKSLGITHVPIVTYPGVIATDTSEVFTDKVQSILAKNVVKALTDRAQATPLGAADGPHANPRSVVFAGSLDEVQAHFEAEQWTDGLPIIPPTLDRVERALAYTRRDPDERIGILPPERRAATVWNVAVNGVMAGCKPEYMPVLLAIVECLADPTFRVEDAGSTPGWEPLVTLSGPLVKSLGFNYEAGVMRVGRTANTSVGRFVRLYLRNVAGLRILPGHTDQGAIATSFNVVLAENDAATREVGWVPSRVEQGHSLDDSVVTVRSVVSISPPIYTGGDHAEDHLSTIAEIVRNAMGPWGYTGLATQTWYPLLVIGPAVASALAGFGVSKDDIRAYLHSHVKQPVDLMERYAKQVGSSAFDVADLVSRGLLGPEFTASDDPKRLVPIIVRPEWTSIVVSGSPNRNQSRAYVNNHVQGVPVSRVVDENLKEKN